MTVAAPVLRLLLRARARAGKELASRLPERHGVDPTPRPTGRLFWLHAASVGETVSVMPVMQALFDRAPAATVLLTTGTLTSARLLAHRLPEFGPHQGRVLHRFVPLDVPAWVARFLAHWQPDAAGFVESELWPNMIAACRARRIPLALLNARLSRRSFERWKRVPGLARELLAAFARIEAQSDADAERLRSLGARTVERAGNLKFAAPPLPVDPNELRRLQSLLAGRPVWLAASTHPAEEVLVLAAHRIVARTHPGMLTIITPRHPERGAAIAQQVAELPVSRRSLGEDPPTAGVWLADTLGELGLFYRLSPIAFIGRSLIPPGGGQNPLEAARLGCAIATGPHTANFADIVDLLRRSGSLTVVSGSEALAAWVDTMLDDAGGREAAGRAGIAAASGYTELPARVANTLLGLVR